MAYEQSATSTIKCPQCAGVATYDVVGWLDGVRIRWDASERCAGCAYAVEILLGPTADGNDHALLRAQGGWFGLQVSVPDADRVRLVKELRAALNLPMSEAARMLTVRTGPLACGLELEMRRLEAIVRQAVTDARTTVVRVGD
ncbi:hypothetical protein AB0B66_10870 [Catellatospora sp. NPDC049111]|uniref:hypothetical protein n=1 Tax=Catellatospora sp. NPDC049111 TaxID=3155271 RepID=UPI0033FDB282